MYNSLQSQLGMTDALNLTEELSYLGQENIAKEDFTEHPEVLLQDMELKVVSSKLNEARAAQLPSLSIGYQYSYNFV